MNKQACRNDSAVHDCKVTQSSIFLPSKQSGLPQALRRSRLGSEPFSSGLHLRPLNRIIRDFLNCRLRAVVVALPGIGVPIAPVSTTAAATTRLMPTRTNAALVIPTSGTVTIAPLVVTGLAVTLTTATTFTRSTLGQSTVESGHCLLRQAKSSRASSLFGFFRLDIQTKTGGARSALFGFRLRVGGRKVLCEGRCRLGSGGIFSFLLFCGFLGCCCRSCSGRLRLLFLGTGSGSRDSRWCVLGGRRLLGYGILVVFGRGSGSCGRRKVVILVIDLILSRSRLLGV